MADKTINTLDTELVTVGANDLIGVWDVAAAQYKKAKRSNLVGATITGGGTIALGGYTLTVPASMTAAGRNTAQTFTGVQTMQDGAAIGVAGSKLYRPTAGVIRQNIEWVTIANLATVVARDDGAYAMVQVFSATHGRYGLFAIEGNGNGRLVHGDSTLFKTTGNTQIMCFALSNVVYVQNFTGSNLIMSCVVWV